MLKNSLQQTEAESGRMDQEQTNVQSKNDVIDLSLIHI